MNNNVAVVGLGYVGLPLALLSARKGYTVYGIDTQKRKIDLLEERISPIKDESIERDLQNLGTDKIHFGTEYAPIAACSIVIITVPTPVHKDHRPDLEPVTRAAESIAEYLVKDQLIILESTVNPGVSEEVVAPILEAKSNLKCGVDFHLAHCPERINPGDKRWNVENIPRVVGSTSAEGLARSIAFYTSIITGEIKPMNSIREAEAVKIVENSFRDINIAFVNELAMSFSKLGIDAVNVIKGASTKPFGFMPHFPSCGVGGHCIPVDPYYLIDYAENNGFHHEFLILARKINNHMPEFTVGRLIDGLNEKRMAPNGTPVAVLGLAYKPNIDDSRESPSFEIIEHIKRAGADVRSYDPYIPEKSTVNSLEEALSGAYALVIATAHDEFKSLSPELLSGKGIRVVVDGCNCLSKEAFVGSGLVYRGIGK